MKTITEFGSPILYWIALKLYNATITVLQVANNIARSIDAFIIRWTRLFITVFWLFGFPSFIYLTFFQSPNPIKMISYSNPIILKPSNMDGGMYSIHFTKQWCFTEPVDIYVLPQFTDGLTFNVPSKGLLHYEAGCYKQVIPVDIPPEFVNGTYTYNVEYDIILNTFGIPTRTLHIHYNVFTLDVVDQVKGIYNITFNTNLKPVTGSNIINQGD